jgi:hypothetical protein
VTLKASKTAFPTSADVQLTGVFENVGPRPLAMTFWWNRSMRITDAAGKTLVPGAGPVLPCGAAETPHLLAPGARHERTEPLGCTQCAGLSRAVGWSYTLPAGRYRIVLIYENPAPHGHWPNRVPDAWRGRVESEPVEITIGKP